MVFTLEYLCEISYTVLNIRDPHAFQSTFTFQIILVLVPANVAPNILIHPIPSFHAYPEKVLVSGTKTISPISIQPTLSLQRFPESVQLPRGFHVGSGDIITPEASSPPTQPIVSIQKCPVSVLVIAHELNLLNICAPVYPPSVGATSKSSVPALPDKPRTGPLPREVVRMSFSPFSGTMTIMMDGIPIRS